MQWILEHTFSFDSAHALEGLPVGHPCSSVHGHTWKTTVRIACKELSAEGFVIDFKELKTICKEKLHDLFDHKLINAYCDFSPTCENISKHFYSILCFEVGLLDSIRLQVHSVTVMETEGNQVTYGG